MLSATVKVGIMIILLFLEAMVSTTRKVGIMIICVVFRSYGISYRKGWNNHNLYCI